MKIMVSSELKKHMDISELQQKVDRLKRLYNYAEYFRASNTYDLKIDLERATEQLNNMIKER